LPRSGRTGPEAVEARGDEAVSWLVGVDLVAATCSRTKRSYGLSALSESMT
jgi:hypothetical protein